MDIIIFSKKIENNLLGRPLENSNLAGFSAGVAEVEEEEEEELEELEELFFLDRLDIVLKFIYAVFCLDLCFNFFFFFFPFAQMNM